MEPLSGQNCSAKEETGLYGHTSAGHRGAESGPLTGDMRHLLTGGRSDLGGGPRQSPESIGHLSPGDTLGCGHLLVSDALQGNSLDVLPSPRLCCSDRRSPGSQ